MSYETPLNEPPKRLVMPKSGSKPYSFGEPTWTRRFAIRIVIGAAIVGALISGGLVFALSSFNSSNVAAAGATLGQVALTESQLRDQVISHKLTAYWVGPMPGAKYSLISNANGQAFVRYLPNGQGLEDTNATYRVIATYPQSDAFSITKSAGNQANAISFTNSDGAQVFYSKSYAANVYVAFADSPYEIEIFDPKDGAALNLATTAGTLTKIK